MKQNTISTKQAKKRQILLFLPLLAIPLITILFYVIGGGQSKALGSGSHSRNGLNFKLPLPQFREDSALDKMSYYDQAAADSIKWQLQLKKDTNSNKEILQESLSGFAPRDFAAPYSRKAKAGFGVSGIQNTSEQKVYEKLHALQRAIKDPLASYGNGQDMREFENYGAATGVSDEIKNLQEMLSARDDSPDPDPELKELGAMLENILDIQHPLRVEERLKESAASRKGKIYTVKRKESPDNTSSLKVHTPTSSPVGTNAFYTADQSLEPEQQSNSIQAVIHQTQTLVNGSMVKLRLQGDIMLQGMIVPRNTFLYGTASLNGERLEVEINNIQFQNSIFPVQLALYDLDGIKGIYIPGAISRDVAKASADRSVASLGLTGLSDSWQSQAAGMGMEAAKSLMSRKMKLIQVVVKAGYQVLLYDEKQKMQNN